jgi:hypothetical protein
MSDQNQALRTRTNMRSDVRIEHVLVEKNGFVRRAHLPIGKGFGDGSPLYWINQGWQTAEAYDAEKHKMKVEAEQAAAAKAEAEKAEKVDKPKKAEK